MNISISRNISTKEREEAKDSDFVVPENRSYPILKPSDVMSAVHAFGMGKNNLTFDEFKARLTRIAKRKGFEAELPESWSKDKKDIKASFDKIILLTKELKGYADCCAIPSYPGESSNYESDYNYSYLQSRIDELWRFIMDWQNSHLEGHIPACKSVDQLKKAVDVLGLSGEYDIQKQVIFSSEGQPEGLVVNFIKNKV